MPYPDDVGIMILVKGIIVHANKAAAEMHNTDADNLRGKAFIDLFCACDSDGIRHGIKETIAKKLKSKKKGMFRALTADGEMINVLGTSKHCTWNGEEAVMAIGRKIDTPVQMPLKFGAGDR